MNNERIVITGVGVMSPNGVGRDQYFAALAGGRSGVRGITLFDASNLTSRVAGEVDFDPAPWIDAKNMKHVGRIVPMVVAATDEALRDAKLDPTAVDLETRRSI
ncbi:MAG: beta-ketoacyl synthase N-terminal-like domain-containing protein, partial [Thermoanaerobaculia bacterium]